MLLGEQIVSQIGLCVINEIIAVVGLHLGGKTLALGVRGHLTGCIVGNTLGALHQSARCEMLQEIAANVHDVHVVPPN